MKARYNEHNRCCCCEGSFMIPSFPKLLPCLDVICIDCLKELIKQQKTRNDYSENENEVYCPRCKKYVRLPMGDVNDLPTAYNLIKKTLQEYKCSEEGCKNNVIAYCYNCKKLYCQEHGKEHIMFNENHQFEVFMNKKHCLKHSKDITAFCCTCNKIICDDCYRESHLENNHIVCEYVPYLTQFYSNKKLNISKRVYQLTSLVKKASSIYDNIYFYQANSAQEQLEFASYQLDEFMEQKMKERIKECGIEESMAWLGRREDIQQFYNAFDAFLLPSIYEGLPVVGLESQSAGLPMFFSTAITPEASACELGHFIPLAAGASGWAEKVIEETVKNMPIRRSHAKEVADAGFDSRTEAAKMLQFYLNAVEEQNRH